MTFNRSLLGSSNVSQRWRLESIAGFNASSRKSFSNRCPLECLKIYTEEYTYFIYSYSIQFRRVTLSNKADFQGALYLTTYNKFKRT